MTTMATMTEESLTLLTLTSTEMFSNHMSRNMNKHKHEQNIKKHKHKQDHQTLKT